MILQLELDVVHLSWTTEASNRRIRASCFLVNRRRRPSFFLIAFGLGVESKYLFVDKNEGPERRREKVEGGSKSWMPFFDTIIEDRGLHPSGAPVKRRKKGAKVRPEVILGCLFWTPESSMAENHYFFILALL